MYLTRCLHHRKCIGEMSEEPPSKRRKLCEEKWVDNEELIEFLYQTAARVVKLNGSIDNTFGSGRMEITTYKEPELPPWIDETNIFAVKRLIVDYLRDFNIPNEVTVNVDQSMERTLLPEIKFTCDMMAVYHKRFSQRLAHHPNNNRLIIEGVQEICFPSADESLPALVQQYTEDANLSIL